MTATNEKPNDWERCWTPIAERRQQLEALGEDLKMPQVFHILGAGAAGLTAAVEILRLPTPGGRRHEVRIYEGSDRVGGRIHTKRLGDRPKPGEADTRPYFEYGAMRIPSSHDYTWAYAREAGLARRRFLNDDRSHDFHGTVHHPPDLKALARAYGVRDPEVERGPGHLYAKNVLGPELASLDREYGSRRTWARLLLDGRITGTGLRRIDAMDLATTLAVNLQNDPGQVRFLADLLFAGLEDRAFLLFVRFWLTNQGAPYELCRRQTDEVVGGMDLWTKGLRARIEAVEPDAIRTRCPVTAIRIEGDSWRVDFANRRPIVKQPGHHLLCTLPFSILRDPGFGLEGFSDDKLAAISNLSYAHATKVALHVSGRFWEDRLKGGRSLNDRLTRSTYYPNDHNPVEPIPERQETHAPYDLYTQPRETLSPRQQAALAAAERRPGPWLMLSSYTFGRHAERMGSLPPEATVEDLRRVFPDVDRHVVDRGESETWYWHDDCWAKGPFALPIPRDVSRHYQAARRPDGGVYFAGDHVSLAPGWIQGACHSSLWSLERMLEDALGLDASREAAGRLEAPVS